jgi:NADH-quinone oxidoreductase subunit G
MQIYVDQRAYEVNAEHNLLEACLSRGLDLPYFCWHPALGSVGACRQCAVKVYRDANDKQGRLVMACMTPVAKDMLVSIEDPEARQFRAGIIEGLMTNHPHDCPVCDEGGECHLQDMTVMTGHDYRRYAFLKRTFPNQYLGPLVNQEFNRCIQCYRCVRFYNEYAGGHDFNNFLLRDLVFFGRAEDGVLENEFAGNLVEVCPTGVFTDKTLKRHYTRKWDMRMAPTICVHCGLGCNVTAGERSGVLRRIVNRYNGEVNRYFLCDRGRFAYEFVNHLERIRQPLVRREGAFEAVSRQEAVGQAAALFGASKQTIGIGSPRASLESNYALRTLVGPENFYAGVSAAAARLLALMQGVLATGPSRSASLGDVEESTAVLVLGEDVTNVAPRMALSLRQSVRQEPLSKARQLKIPAWQDHAVREAAQEEKGPLYIASPYATHLDDVARETYHGSPEDIARLGFAVAHALDPGAPTVPDLAPELEALARRIAQDLGSAAKPLVVSGVSCASEAVIQAAANVARALCRDGRVASLAFTMPECNSFGLAWMTEKTLDDAIAATRRGEIDAVIVLENDLYRRAPAGTVDGLLDGKRVIVLDAVRNRTTEKATVVLAAGTFAESDGTLVSSEGRAQRFFQVFLPQDGVDASWRWLRDVMEAAGRPEARAWQSLDDVVRSVAEGIPALRRITEAAPASSFRIAGAKVPREPHRFSGRTSILANISVHEPKPPEDPDSALSFTMEGTPAQPPSALIPFFWSPGWNSIQSVNKFQEEVAGPLRGGDPGVRLLEPPAETRGGYFSGVPAAFQRRAGEWLLIPRHHIFGSEELSRLAPGIAELAAKPYVALNPEDADRLAVPAGAAVEVTLDGQALRLPVQLEPSLPPGIAALPEGVPPVAGEPFPVWGRIARLT